jgi:OOP family OmpA-OmpF porin
MAKRSSLWVGAAIALALSACSGAELERTSGMTPTGPEFNRALFAEYIALSRTEYTEGDYGNSDAFALRARSIGQGTMVEPEEVSARKIPADKTQELTTYRGRLLNALRGGARERLPRDAAHAQAMFDCWLEEQEENIQPNDLAACRNGFLNALAKIEGAPAAQPAPAPQAETIMILFDFNKATLNAAANTEINRAVARIRALNAKTVVLEGHADRSGADAYNMRLSQSRVAAVRQALQKAGVNVRFDESAVGETRPIVPTPDGTREARNRAVTVRIVP